MRSGRDAIIMLLFTGVAGVVVCLAGCSETSRPDDSRAKVNAPTTDTHDHIPPPRTPEN